MFLYITEFQNQVSRDDFCFNSFRMQLMVKIDHHQLHNLLIHCKYIYIIWDFIRFDVYYLAKIQSDLVQATDA